MGIGRASGFARDIKNLSHGIRDIGTQFDHISKEMSNADLAELMGVDRSVTGTRDLIHLLDGVNDRLRQQTKIARELAKLREREGEKIKRLQDEIDILEAKNKSMNKWNRLKKEEEVKLKQLYRDQNKHLTQLEKIEELEGPEHLQKMEERWKKLIFQKKAGFIAMKASRVAGAILAKAFYELGEGLTVAFHWSTKLQGALGTLARRLGASTDGLLEMHAAVKASFLGKGGLGDLGFGLEDVTTMMGDFQEQMQYTGKIAPDTALGLVRLGITAGMSAQQVGELARSITVMGGGAEDVTRFIHQLDVAAKHAGVTSASMTKQLQGAGKALFELTSPKLRTQLQETMRYLSKMGTGLDKIKGFVDLTDTFDKTAESMAKLNTVFGTHINALQLFAEQDPARRFEMLRKQLELQGVSLDMMRQEKKFIADTLALDQETANALMNAASSGMDMAKWSEQQKKLDEERAQWAGVYEKNVRLAKNALIAMEQVAGRIGEGLSKMLDPFFKGFKFAAGISKEMSVFDGFLEKAGRAFSTMATKFEQAGLSNKLFRIGEAFGYLFDQLLSVVASDEFTSFMSGVLDVMIAAAQGFALFVSALVKMITYVGAVIGKVIGGVKWLFNLGGGVDAAPSSATRAIDPGYAAKWDEREAFKTAPSGMQVGLAGMAPGQATAATPAPRASGGNTEALMPYWVGESGKELFVPSTDGTVVPPARAAGMSGPAEVLVPVQVIVDGELLQETMFKRNLRSHN